MKAHMFPSQKPVADHPESGIRGIDAARLLHTAHIMLCNEIEQTDR